MPYADLLPSLITNQMVVVNPEKIYQSPFPRWYNPNATCAYHRGVPRHSIEQCVTYKHEVQSLIDAGWLTFQEDSPNVRTNPFSNHGGSAVNVVEECGPWGLKQMEDVLTSRRFISEALCEAGMICLNEDKGDSCLIHPGASHDVEACSVAKDLLQRMMDKGLIKPRGLQPIPIEKPTPLPYKSNKAVPWRYTAQGPDGRKDASVVHVKDDLSSAKVTNISSTSSMTRSGWIFTAPEPPVRSKDPKGKAKVGIEESNKQNEFKVIEQLNKTPARISLLGLLMNSEPHRALLVKILNETHVAQDIFVEGFGGIINNIMANNYLTFADEEIPVDVSVKCLDHIVAKVHIDNDSSLNVMPKATLDKLSFNASHLRPSSMVVRAF
ncbi:uncharacterized protein LOC114416132 [Glycine soja]|uniref:uncharacterized protein LOC114416132 n=1 Tax=Glycine soja TaxID=3848 RepID=UPI00104037A4|nr:uncharacterized protein LOC114416132 [Glycine soja]